MAPLPIGTWIWTIAEGLDARDATVDQFVRSALQTVGVTESLLDVTKKMRDTGVRRLPIIDEERRLVGILSLDDVLALLGREIADTAAAIGSELEHERRIGSIRKRATGPVTSCARRDPRRHAGRTVSVESTARSTTRRGRESPNRRRCTMSDRVR